MLFAEVWTISAASRCRTWYQYRPPIETARCDVLRPPPGVRSGRTYSGW